MLQPPLENVWLQFCFWATERCSAPLWPLVATPCPGAATLHGEQSQLAVPARLAFELCPAESWGPTPYPSSSLSLSVALISLFLVFLSFPFSSSRFAHFHVFVGLTNRVNAISWLYVFWPLPLASKTSNICPCIMFKLNAHTFIYIYIYICEVRLTFA